MVIYLNICKSSKRKDIIYDMGYYGIRNVYYDFDKRKHPNLPNIYKIKNIKELATKVKKYIDILLTDKTGREYDLSVKEYEK
jgi:hypothetical protein